MRAKAGKLCNIEDKQFECCHAVIKRKRRNRDSSQNKRKINARSCHVISCRSITYFPKIKILNWKFKKKPPQRKEKVLYSHGEIMLNAGCHAGDELEKDNQVLIHADSNLLLLVTLENLPLIATRLGLLLLTQGQGIRVID